MMRKIYSAVYVCGGYQPVYSEKPSIFGDNKMEPLVPRYTLEHDDINECWMVRDGILIGARFLDRQQWMAERYVAMLNKREDERREQALRQAA